MTDVLVDTVMKCSAESCYLLLEVGDTKDEQAAVACYTVAKVASDIGKWKITLANSSGSPPRIALLS